MPRSSFAGRPDLVSTRAELAEALKTVKGTRSYTTLTVESKALAASGSQGTWTPEVLTKGTMSDWWTGNVRALPTRDRLLTFLAICAVPAEQWEEWWQAVNRVRLGARGPRINELDPVRQLNVHPAIALDQDPTGADLTPYIVRAHDRRLRAALAEGVGNQLLVLVGESSTGKTRACYEAVREVLPGWAVLRPERPDEVLALLEAGITRGSVLWLDETQRFLRGPRGAEVAVALRRLVEAPAGAGPDRVVVLGAMWLHEYWAPLTREPQPDEGLPADPYFEARRLLTLPGVRIVVPADFGTATADELAQLRSHAEHEPRLRAAMSGPGPLRVTQNLAGGPQLLDRYQYELPGTSAHILLTSAMDIWRTGFESPIPGGLLDDVVALLADGHHREPFDSAIRRATERLHGVRALTPVSPDTFVLHDYFAQYALRERRREPIPETVWNAVSEHTRNREDIDRIVNGARNRGLIELARRLMDKSAAELGHVLPFGVKSDFFEDVSDGWELGTLAGVLVPRRHPNDVDANIRGIQAWTTAVRSPAGLLADSAQAGDKDAWREIRRLADSGDRNASWILAVLLSYRARFDRAEPLAELSDRADNGDRYAAEALADMLATLGDEAGLAAEVNAGNSRHAVRALDRLRSAKNPRPE